MATRSFKLRVELVTVVLLLVLPRSAAADWPSDPSTNVPLSTATAGQRYPKAAPDATGGAIVAWDDQRGGPRNIYAQRVNGTGTVRWTANGVVLCAATGEQYEPEIVSDGHGGAIVTWSDYRGAASDIYAQRVDSAGTPLWTANGVAVSAATNDQADPAIVADGSGGAILTWDDSRSGISRIYAQRLNASGVPQWTANGVPVTNSPSGQARSVVVSNGSAGAPSRSCGPNRERRCSPSTTAEASSSAGRSGTAGCATSSSITCSSRARSTRPGRRAARPSSRIPTIRSPRRSCPTAQVAPS